MRKQTQTTHPFRGRKGCGTREILALRNRNKADEPPANTIARVAVDQYVERYENARTKMKKKTKKTNSPAQR